MSVPSVPAAITRKAMLRLIPVLGLAYLMSYVDRGSVALAKTRFETDLGIDAAAYGLGAGLFAVSYALLEVPSNLVAHRVGARIWITRIAITWGLVSAAMMFVQGPLSFFLLRLLLGAAEAGLYPAMMYYVTLWFAEKQRVTVVGLLYVAPGIGGILGSPAGGALMTLDGIGGLHGWQWLFLVEGLLTVVVGFVVWFTLPDRPVDARWLSTDEARSLTAAASAGAPESPTRLRGNLRKVFGHPVLLLISGIYFLNQVLASSVGSNTPAIIEAAGFSSTVQIGLITGGIAIGALAGVLIFPWLVRRGIPETTLIVFCAVAATALVAAYTIETAPLMQLWILFGANIVVAGTLPLFWSVAMTRMSGLMAAVGLAFINMIGLIGSFVGPTMYGVIEQNAGATAPFFVLIATSAVAIVPAVVLAVRVRREPARA